MSLYGIIIKRCLGIGGASGAALLLVPAAAAETAAGSRIVNVASIRSDAEAEHPSNPAEIVVAERLDITLRALDPASVPTAELTNAGNGSEAFIVRAAAERAAGVPLVVAVDRDNDGRYDPATDAAVGDDGATPLLAPGATLRLFVLAGNDRSGTVVLEARAATGSGAPGTASPARGDGGGDAVVGPTGAAARVVLAGATPEAPRLLKRQEVLAPDGSARAVPGATITYSLEARFAAATAATRVDDPIPAGTSYVAGSLSLDGVRLSDAADGDPGSAADGRVTVALGPIAAATIRTLRFQVRIEGDHP